MHHKAAHSVTGSYVSCLMDWLETKGGLAKPVFAFFLGIILSRTFEPVGFWPLLFFIVPLMIILIDRAETGLDAFRQGWWTGFGLFTLGLNWVGYSFTQQDVVPPFLAPFAIVGLAAAMALYIAAVFWVSWKLWAPGPLRILIFAAVWTLFEVARGTWFTGLPWHLVGSVWADWLSVAQSAYWLSIYGLSFLTLLIAGSFVPFFEEGKSWWRYGYSALGLVVLIAVAIGGIIRLDKNETRYHVGLTVRLIQPNIPQREKWIPYLINDHFDKYLHMSRQHDEEGKARGVRLLIWPETAVQREDFDREESLLRWRVSRLLEFGSFAITGAPRYEKAEDGTRFYNSLFAVNSRAQLLARYDKVKLVPFGEYLPFADILGTLGLSQLVGGDSFSSGDSAQTLYLPGIPSFSPLICYEAIFPGIVTNPKDRPEWLLNITNDGWFGPTEGPYQHLALARFRAIEEGLPLVRSAGTGVSAIIDPFGRIVTKLDVGKQGAVESPLPMAHDAPPYPTSSRIILTLFLASIVILGRLARKVWSDRAEKKV